MILVAAGLFHSVAQAEETSAFSEVYSECTDKAGINDVAIFHCLIDESRYQDDQLNGIYKKLMAGMPNEKKTLKERLRQAQKGWIGYRNTTCDLLGDFIGEDGWLTKQEPVECEVRLTAARIVELKKIAAYAR